MKGKLLVLRGKLLIIMMGIFLAVPGQEKFLKGTVQDTTLQKAIAGAWVSLLALPDSALKDVVRTDSGGHFQMGPLDAGSYILKITHPLYWIPFQVVTVYADKAPAPLGMISAVPLAKVMEEVKIRLRPPLILKKDTLEYDATFFKVPPNADVEALLKKLPGVQVDRDGKIKVNGQEIQTILVDGKPFFSNDPKIASKNIPAAIIDKVQVFQRRSAQAQFSGMDDGNSTGAINLSLKEGNKQGVFGHAVAGAGTKERHDAQGNINLFNQKRRLSFLASANNTGRQDFSNPNAVEGQNAGGDMGEPDLANPRPGEGAEESLRTIQASGVNFSAGDERRAEVTGSYFYNRLGDKIARTQLRTFFSPTHDPTLNLENATGFTKQAQHRFHIMVNWRLDSTNGFLWENRSVLRQKTQNRIVQYNAIQGVDTLSEGFSNPREQETTKAIFNSLLWRHRFKTKGRTFSTYLSNEVTPSSQESYYYMHRRHYPPGNSIPLSDTVDQNRHKKGSKIESHVRLSFTEPFSAFSILEISASASSVDARLGVKTFEINQNTKQYELLNSLYSTHFEAKSRRYAAGLGWRYVKNHSEWQLRGHFQGVSILSVANDNPGAQVARWYRAPVASLSYHYRPNRYRTLQVEYKTYSVAPSASQLNPVIDIADPLYVRQGNPFLKQENVHKARINYSSLDPYRHRHLFASFEIAETLNQFSVAEVQDSSGSRSSRPINLNGSRLSGLLNAGLPLKGLKLTLRGSSAIQLERKMVYLNEQFVPTNQLGWNGEMSLDYWHEEKFEARLVASLSINSTKAVGLRKNYLTNQYEAGFSWFASSGFTLTTDYRYFFVRGLSAKADPVLLWNTGATKSVFKNQAGEIRVQVFDLLQKNKGVQRRAELSYTEETSSVVTGQYFLLSFIYRMKRFGPTGRVKNAIIF